MKRKTVPSVRTTLWLHPNFLRFWSAETMSLFGTQVTLLALPTIAIVLLQANVAEVGVLNALQWIAFLIVGPLSGVMVDRLSRRTIMIVADLGRLVALGSVPLLFALGVRTLLHLYVVALIVSILTVFFDVAYQSFLPDVVEQEALVEGNALTARRMARILGVGITLNITSFIGASAPLLIPLSIFGKPVLILALWRFLFGFQLPIYNILSVSLRQAVTSRHLQGRMNATMRTMSFGALGIGALAGGLLGIALGLIPTIVIGGCASIIGSLPLLERAVRTQKEQPQEKVG